MADNSYYNNLIQGVIDASESDNWEAAVKEWDICDYEEDENASSRCICGKENIRYLFKIMNKNNGNTLFPIGSSCIKKFERADLNEEISLIEEQFGLLHAFQADDYKTFRYGDISSSAVISFFQDNFSRKLLEWLYNEGAFNTSYNQYDGWDDYTFLLKMYNKRNKYAITNNQRKKMKAIIIYSVEPFVTVFFKKKAKEEAV